MKVELIRGDITAQALDAIVNAANTGLAGGGGVDGAIHRAGGPQIMAECRAIGGCATGDAVATTAGSLSARHVIHAVGPRWRGGNDGEPEALASAHTRSVEVATGLECVSIAFPAISTGIYGFPIRRAAPIAIGAAWAAGQRSSTLELVRFVLFSEDDLAVYSSAASTLGLT